MAIGKFAIGTRTTLTSSALNSLASATYVSAGTITHIASSKTPIDVLLEVEVTPGTVASNKQIVVFAQRSINNTNFETGPTSGTTVTDEPNLVLIGYIPCNTNATLQRGMFSLASVFGGTIPPYTRIIIKNETGAALAASGHAVYYTDINMDIT